MQQEQLDMAKEAAIRILERAAFLFTDEIEDEQCPKANSKWGQKGVALDYQGPVSGELRLWMPESLSRLAAANMLGLDEGAPMSEKEEDDAVKEILNIILGIYLTEAYGTEPVFQLGIPRVLPTEEWKISLMASGHFWMAVEGFPVLLSVHGGK